VNSRWISAQRRWWRMALSRAFDGDELVAVGAAAAGAAGGRDRAGDVVPVDLAVRGGLPELVRAAIGGGGCVAAGGAAGEAAGDAVAVGVVGDDEGALFRGRGRKTGPEGRKGEDC